MVLVQLTVTLIFVFYLWCSWHIVLSMPAGTVMDPPHSLKATEECTLDEVVNLATLHSNFCIA